VRGSMAISLVGTQRGPVLATPEVLVQEPTDSTVGATFDAGIVVVLDFFGARAVAAPACAQVPKTTEVTTSTPTIVQILRDVAIRHHRTFQVVPKGNDRETLFVGRRVGWPF